MTAEQKLGIGALFVIGAIVAGYIVYCIVPDRHYPRVAGALAANGIMAGLTAAGIEPAAYIVIWFALASGYFLLITSDDYS